MADKSFKNMFKNKPIRKLMVITIALFCFNVYAIRRNQVYKPTFNDCAELKIVETEFKGSLPYAETCRYVIENTSHEDISFRLVGIYPGETSEMNKTRRILISDEIYSIEAGTQIDITVTFVPGGYPHEPEVHIIEA